MRKIRSIIILSLLLSGCATGPFGETAYKPNGLAGGYSETHLDKNIFEVSFWANENTTLERINDFTLLRSAELTVDNGYKYFIITSTHSTSAYLSSEYKKPRRQDSIVCLMEKPKHYDVYDASFLLKSIKQKYKMDS